jgi:hypothetical protein
VPHANTDLAIDPRPLPLSVWSATREELIAAAAPAILTGTTLVVAAGERVGNVVSHERDGVVRVDVHVVHPTVGLWQRAFVFYRGWDAHWRPVRVFVDADRNASTGVVAFGVYHPYRAYGERNPAFDAWSGRILDLKEDDQRAITYFRRVVDPQLGEGFAVATVPPHDPARTSTGIRRLAQALCTGRDRLDATGCLARRTRIAKLAAGGLRDARQHLTTIEVQHPELIEARAVLLLDDVTTTGGSLAACEQLLLASGAAVVRLAALGRTQR